MQGGTGLKVKIDVASTLTAIAELLDGDMPPQLKELAEMTAHPTTGNTTYRTFVDTGLRELGEFQMTLGWDTTETTHSTILTAFAGTDPVAMSIEDPAGAEVIAFDAHIRQISRISKQTDGYKAQVTVRPTGAPTIT